MKAWLQRAFPVRLHSSRRLQDVIRPRPPSISDAEPEADAALGAAPHDAATQDTKQDLIDALTPVGVVFLVAVLFSIGLHILPSDITQIVLRRGKSRTAYALVLLTTTLIQPAIGYVTVAAAQHYGLSPAAAAGFLIAACCPGGSFSNIISYAAGANIPLNAALTMSETALSFVLVPIGLLGFLPAIYADVQTVPRVPYRATHSALPTTHAVHLPSVHG